jgi:twitching motility protein PilT
MNLLDLLSQTIEKKASDLHITVAVPPTIRVNGSLERLGDQNITTKDTIEITQQMLGEKQLQELENKGEIDFSYSNPGLGRFRVNIYKQRGSYGIAIGQYP